MSDFLACENLDVHYEKGHIGLWPGRVDREMELYNYRESAQKKSAKRIYYPGASCEEYVLQALRDSSDHSEVRPQHRHCETSHG